MNVEDLREGLVVTTPFGMGTSTTTWKIESWKPINDKVALVTVVSLDGKEKDVFRNLYLTPDGTQISE